MVVSQHAAAYTFERRIAADKVMRKAVYEIYKIDEGVAVDLHRRVRRIDSYTVLTEISVGRILPKPIFAVKLDRYRPKCTLSAFGKAFVFAADNASGITALDCIAAFGIIGVAEFRLGKINCYNKPVSAETRISVENRFLDVIVRHAIIVKTNR